MYSPTGSSASTYAPSGPVVVSRCRPVLIFFALTFAPAMTLPLGSVTVPRMDPRKLCARADPVISNIAARLNVRNKIASFRKISLPLRTDISLGKFPVCRPSLSFLGNPFSEFRAPLRFSFPCGE